MIATVAGRAYGRGHLSPVGQADTPSHSAKKQSGDKKEEKTGSDEKRNQ